MLRRVVEINSKTAEGEVDSGEDEDEIWKVEGKSSVGQKGY